MGWDELRKISPRFFAKLVAEHRATKERDQWHGEFMAAQIVAMIANTGYKGWKDVRQPREFMPSYLRQRQEHNRPKTHEEIAARVRRVVGAAFGDK